MDTPSVQAAKVAHHAAVVHDTAVHMQAKADAAMYKAHVPHVYTHQTPYVYNYNPVVYTQPKVANPRVYTLPKVADPRVYTLPKVADPRVYVAAPVAYTTPYVYNYAYPYATQHHTLHKRGVKSVRREAEAEAEADPQGFYNTYGYYPHGYTALNDYYGQQAVVYTTPDDLLKKVPKTYAEVPVGYTAPVTYTQQAVAPVTYTHHQVAIPVTYTNHHQSMVYNHGHAYPYASQFNTVF